MKQHNRLYREIFFAHMGTGPYPCLVCEKDVTFDEVIIHHANHDDTDDQIENLKPVHRGCHTKHHSIGRGTGIKRSEETKAKMRESHRQRWAAMTKEQRSAIGQKAADSRDSKTALQKAWVTRRLMRGEMP